jgi:ribosomal protein S12 methylthiotransferase accessory factor
MRSTFLPAARRGATFGPDAVDAGIDDCNAYPRIDLDGAGWPVDELMAKFETAGLRPVVRDITSDFGIACVIASAIDDSVPGFPQAHSGLGCHPVARIAVVRALTELAQSRAVDIQGVREDILPPEATPEPHQRHTQRLRRIDHRRWILRDEGPAIPLRQVRSTANEDIAEDIHLILSAFVSDGLERAIVIDLSEPGGFAVVRVIVPGLEFWIIDHGKIGERALRFWKRHAGVV